jgi:hypothetical protein
MQIQVERNGHELWYKADVIVTLLDAHFQMWNSTGFTALNEADAVFQIGLSKIKIKKNYIFILPSIKWLLKFFFQIF